uniref:Uncharacterized protein n=1 Tax=Panagrolaimus sp. JU765 TaxID=591449 RepID=A0AC34R6T8_9BILA
MCCRKKQVQATGKPPSKKELAQKDDGPKKEDYPSPGPHSQKDKKETGKKMKTIEEEQPEIAAPGPAKVEKEKQQDTNNNNDIFPVASLKKDVPSVDRSAEKMSLDNTLKEIPKRMPETDIVHDKESIAQIFTDDQLI